MPPGLIVTDRTIFYVADDGVLEKALSSVNPAGFVTEFEERFRRCQVGDWLPRIYIAIEKCCSSR
ncbi:hypothetical protein ACQPZ2_24630 [Nocardia pseudovaccinii]|uniref:hypothetical protein n=1 Tax=Nocardia pseudovaccinii TaxID=189540 RepID=UPI003D94BA1A